MESDNRRGRPEAWLAAVFMLVLRIALAVAVGYVLFRLGFIILVVILSVMLALTVEPLVQWLQRSNLLRPLARKYRRGVAAGVIFILVGFLVAGVTALIVQPLLAELHEFFQNWSGYQAQLSGRIQWLQERYTDLPPAVQAWISDNGVQSLGDNLSAQMQAIAHNSLRSGTLLLELVLIPILAFSFLTESRPLKRELLVLVPRGRLRDALHVAQETGVILQSYAVGQLILALIAGGVVWVMLTFLGIHYALALAVVAAITRVIPVIGPMVGGVPIVLIASLQGWDRGLFVLIAFTLMHLIESKLVMPRIIGHRINLHPAMVIIALLVGAEFFGMWGMFLAAPVTAVVKELIIYFFVRPQRPRRPRTPQQPAPAPRKEPELERPAVAGVRSHSGAH